MCMRNGEPLQGIEFFNQLSDDEDFCKELGRAMLAAGRLEAELIRYFSITGIDETTNKANLGRLLRIAKKNEILVKMIPALEMLNEQRNYLAHNIYALFSGQVEETILPRSVLIDSDIDVFTERAWQLKENLNGLANIVSKYIKST